MHKVRFVRIENERKKKIKCKNILTFSGIVRKIAYSRGILYYMPLLSGQMKERSAVRACDCVLI